MVTKPQYPSLEGIGTVRSFVLTYKSHCFFIPGFSNAAWPEEAEIPEPQEELPQECLDTGAVPQPGGTQY